MSEEQFTVTEVSKDIYSGNTSLVQEQIVTYLHDHTEYIPYKGILVYVKDTPHPKKGFPTPEAVFAIGQIKTIIKESLRFPILLLLANKEKLLTSFNKISNKSLYPYMIKEEYLCPTAYNTYLFIYTFLSYLKPKIDKKTLKETSMYFAHLVEYDDAYRYRIQDMATASSYSNLITSPRNEIKRLFSLFTLRSHDAVPQKLFPMVNLLSLLLLIPSVNKAFIQATPFIQGMAYDEADLFWVYSRGDAYDFLGFSPDERNSKITMPQAYTITL